MSQSCPGSQRKVAWKLSYGGATWMLANAEIPLPVKLLGDVGGVLLTATRWPPPSWQLNLATASQRPTYRCRVFSVFRWFWICAIIVFLGPHHLDALLTFTAQKKCVAAITKQYDALCCVDPLVSRGRKQLSNHRGSRNRICHCKEDQEVKICQELPQSLWVCVIPSYPFCSDLQWNL